MSNEYRRFREQRALAQMSQARAACAIGVDRSTLSLFENGLLNLKPAMLARLARVYERALHKQRARFDRIAPGISQPVDRNATKAVAASA